MLVEVIFAKLDQGGRRLLRSLGKDLRMDMTAELLNPYFVITRARGDCKVN